MFTSKRSIVAGCTILIGLFLGSTEQALTQSPSGKSEVPSPGGKSSANIESPSTADRASASVNFAMAAFRRMMGDLDVKDVEKASSDRNATVTELALAATMYKAITPKASERRVDSVANTTQEACDTGFVRRQAAAYDVKLPVSQQDLPVVMGRVVEQLRASIEKFDVTTALKDERARRTIERQVDTTLLFLSCVTTA
jgi:hypothetical protein